MKVKLEVFLIKCTPKMHSQTIKPQVNLNAFYIVIETNQKRLAVKLLKLSSNLKDKEFIETVDNMT